MRRFAGYIRVSRVGDRAATLISPDLQEKELRGWESREGDVVLEMAPPELDESGAKDERPILQREIERIARGELHGIAVWNFARFTRSLASSIRFLEEIEGAGGQLVSTSQPVDARTPAGKMTRNFFFSIHQAEREEAAAGFEAAKASAIERGIWTAPHVPFGYRKNEERRLEHHPVEAPARAEIIRMRAGGRSWTDVKAHVKARTGRDFTRSAVVAMVKSRLNIGEMRQGDHVNPEAIDPIIDRATWEAARVAHAKPPRSSVEPALLAGLVRCAGCCRCISYRIRKGSRFGECRRRHRTGDCPEPATANEELERYVVNALFAHAREVAYTAAERSAAVEEAVRALEEAEAELALYQQTVRISDVGAEHFEAGMKIRVEAVESARRALAAARLAAPRVLPGTLEEVWPQLAVEERQQVLRSAFSVVWLRGSSRHGGSIEDRVRLVAAGYEPAGLSTRGRTAGPITTLAWDGDLEGEIRVPSVENGGEAAGGAAL